MLKPDGSNMGQWCKDLRELGREHLSDPKFFFKPGNNSIFEQIGRAIILVTLQAPLTYEFQDFPTAYGMYKAARTKFNNISQAAQINVWKRFISFKLDDSMSTVGVSARLKEWWWEWSNMHVDILRDTFLAFVAQNGLPQGSRLNEEVDRRIEHILLENNHQQISLTAILHLIESCRQQLQHKGLTNTSIPTTFLAKTDGQPQENFPNIVYPIEAYLNQIDKDLWDQAVNFFAARAAKCWQCGSNDHIKRQCPERNRNFSSVTN